MKLRVKLIGAMLLVALMVPVLGGIAISRVSQINDDVDTLGTEMPRLIDVKDLERLQREQQQAVLAYVSQGNPQELTRFQDLSAEFDRLFTGLKDSGSQDQKAMERIAQGRATFLDVAGQLLGSRASLDRALTDLGTRNTEISDELASVRNRYVPTTSNAPVDPSAIPPTLRVQINDLLVGQEGMLHIVSLQAQLATSYALRPDDAAKQMFQKVAPTFTAWFNIANAAGGSDDRAILARVQNRYVNQFEPSGKAIMQATDFANNARSSFNQASTSITDELNTIVAGQLAQVTRSQENAKSIAGDATGLMLFVTLAAFIVAGAVGLILANAIVGPIVRLRDVADRVSRGEMDDVAIDVRAGDEIGDLAGAFRRMVASVRFLMAGDLMAEEPVIEPQFGMGPGPAASPAGD